MSPTRELLCACECVCFVRRVCQSPWCACRQRCRSHSAPRCRPATDSRPRALASWGWRAWRGCPRSPRARWHHSSGTGRRDTAGGQWFNILLVTLGGMGGGSSKGSPWSWWRSRWMWRHWCCCGPGSSVSAPCWSTLWSTVQRHQQKSGQEVTGGGRGHVCSLPPFTSHALYLKHPSNIRAYNSKVNWSLESIHLKQFPRWCDSTPMQLQVDSRVPWRGRPEWQQPARRGRWGGWAWRTERGGKKKSEKLQRSGLQSIPLHPTRWHSCVVLL